MGQAITKQAITNREGEQRTIRPEDPFTSVRPKSVEALIRGQLYCGNMTHDYLLGIIESKFPENGRQEFDSTLESLADQGIIAISKHEEKDSPPIRVYSLTPKGRRDVDAGIAEIKSRRGSYMLGYQ